MRTRRIIVGVFACLALVAVARHPSADIRVLTHDATDLAPHRVSAALDLGVVALSVLVTWSSEHIR